MTVLTALIILVLSKMLIEIGTVEVVYLALVNLMLMAKVNGRLLTTVGLSLTGHGFIVDGVYRCDVVESYSVFGAASYRGEAVVCHRFVEEDGYRSHKVSILSVVAADSFGDDDDVVSGSGAGLHGREAGAYDEEADC